MWNYIGYGSKYILFVPVRVLANWKFLCQWEFGVLKEVEIFTSSEILRCAVEKI